MTRTTWWIIGVGVILIIIVLIWRAAVVKPPEVPEELPPTQALPVEEVKPTLVFLAQAEITEEKASEVEFALMELEGVQEVKVDIQKRSISVVYDQEAVEDISVLQDQILEKLTELGIEAKTTGAPPFPAG